MKNLNGSTPSSLNNLSSNTNNFTKWLKVTNNPNGLSIGDDITAICKNYQESKRWTLCVNFKENQLKKLAKNIDSTKLLRVNSKNNDLTFEKITRALKKGNCSTVILCCSDFNLNQLLELQHCAQVGNTKCIVINKPNITLH